jgi:hypothetical protein
VASYQANGHRSEIAIYTLRCSRKGRRCYICTSTPQQVYPRSRSGTSSTNGTCKSFWPTRFLRACLGRARGRRRQNRDGDERVGILYGGENHTKCTCVKTETYDPVYSRCCTRICKVPSVDFGFKVNVRCGTVDLTFRHHGEAMNVLGSTVSSPFFV